MTKVVSASSLCPSAVTAEACLVRYKLAQEKGWTVLPTEADVQAYLSIQELSPSPQTPMQSSTGNSIPDMGGGGTSVIFIAGGIIGVVYLCLDAMRTGKAKRAWEEKDNGLFPGSEYSEPSPWTKGIPPEGREANPVSKGPRFTRVYPNSQHPGYLDSPDETPGLEFTIPPAEAPGGANPHEQMEPIAAKGATGSAPIPDHGGALFSPPWNEWGRTARDVLRLCPVSIADSPTFTELSVVFLLLMEGDSQTQIIERIWGVKKGGSDRFKRARRRLEFYKGIWGEYLQEIEYRKERRGELYGQNNDAQAGF